jgi:hypothetical protein
VQRDYLKPFGDYAPNAIAALERCEAEDIALSLDLFNNILIDLPSNNIFDRFAFKFSGFHFIFLLIVGALLPLVSLA